MHPLDDTIVAIASPPGGAARGIVRLSGPAVRATLADCFRTEHAQQLPVVARTEVICGSLRLEGFSSPLPCEVYLWPDGRSYTGQPVAELHTLGSPPLLHAVVTALCAAGARLAEPGEFTLRAFLAGRIDLSQAEAVLGVIDAADRRQLDVALAQLAGGLAAPLKRLRDSLVDLLADLEAGFDFADEDLPFITAHELNQRLAEAAEQVAGLRRQMASRGETAATLRAVLVGWPNVGKSSLFNALTRHSAALVCEHPGTTRDYLTSELDLDGVRCELIDTAGMAADPPGHLDELEQAAQAVSARQSRQAAVQILCLDATRPPNQWERDELQQPPDGVRVVVWTKIDLAKPADAAGAAGPSARPCATASPEAVPSQAPQGALLASKQWHTADPLCRAVPTSSVTGEGIDVLRDKLREAVLSAEASDAGVVAGTAVRCRESLRLASASLNRAARLARRGTGEELVAAEVRAALDELGKVVGAVYTDDVLDRIFSRFCIGK